MRFSPQGPSLLVQAPAKLNLSLQVLGRREDGYHDLHTLMVSLALYDTLSFESLASPEIQLSCSSGRSTQSALPVDERNLVVRAARLLQNRSGCERGARIALWKRIPSEAGLGGGSSDAAATLVALNKLWGLELPVNTLHAAAAELGSDVNFFLDSQPAAVCLSRGEDVTPVRMRAPLHFVIAKPEGGLSTAKVFQKWLMRGTPERSDHDGLLRALWEGSAVEVARRLSNDLEDPARQLSDEIDGVLKKLERSGGLGSGMTGSGSACFTVCRSRRHAHAVAGRCRGLGIEHVFTVSSGI